MHCMLLCGAAGAARFLEARQLPAEALQVAADPDYKFELAVQLGELSIAQSIAGTQSAASWH